MKHSYQHGLESLGATLFETEEAMPLHECGSAMVGRLKQRLLELTEGHPLVPRDKKGRIRVEKVSGALLESRIALDSLLKENIQKTKKGVLVTDENGAPQSKEGKDSLTPQERWLIFYRNRPLQSWDDWSSMVRRAHLSRREQDGMQDIFFIRSDDYNLAQAVNQFELTPERRVLGFARGGDYTLRRLVLELGRELTPGERKIALIRGGDWTLSELVALGELSPEERNMAVIRGGQRTLEMLVHRGLTVEEIDQTLDRCDDAYLKLLMVEGLLTPKAKEVAVGRGSDSALSALLAGYELSAVQNAIVFARAGDETLAQMAYRGLLTPEQEDEAFYRGGEKTLSQLVETKGHDLSPWQKDVALVRGGDETLARMVQQGLLKEEFEVDLAIYLGEDQTFEALAAETHHRLTSFQEELFQIIARRRRRYWWRDLSPALQRFCSA